MKLKCPVCKERLKQDFVCKNLHQYFMDEGVLQLMTPDFKTTLESWLTDFDQFRVSSIQKLNFNALPQSGIKIDKNIWKARTEDISIISNLVNDQAKTALDIGSWNGWLSNYLSKKGIKTTAIDHFVNELDGLKSKKFYEHPNWNSIQMDIEDLSVLDSKFDLIVLNRCFPYFTTIDKVINGALDLLSSKGQLIITGLNISNQTGDTIELIAAKIDFKEQFNRDFLFKPFKGYVDENDISNLKAKGFKVQLYPNLKNRTKKLLSSNRNITYYAVYNK